MNVFTSEREAFAAHLRQEERSSGTIEKYLRDAAEFSRWLGGRALNKEAAAGWREHLLEERYAPATINFHAVGGQCPASVSGAGGLPDQVSPGAAQGFPGAVPGIDAG